MVSLHTLDALQDIIIVIDTSNRIGYINLSGAGFFGVSQREAVGRSFLDFVGGNISFSVGEHDIELRNKGGGITLAHATVAEVLGQKNRLLGHSLIVRNQTPEEVSEKELYAEVSELDRRERDLDQQRMLLLSEKQALEQKIDEHTRHLSDEHARLYASINNLSLGFVMTDAHGRISMVNKATRQLFNLPADANNLKLEDLQKHVDGGVEFLQSIEKSLTSGRQLFFEDIRIRNTYTNIFVSPIIITRENTSSRIGSVVLIVDKTEERLIKRSRDNFFVIASHELRTPLTGIRGYISIIKELYSSEIRDEKLKQIITDIDVSSSRLIKIINEFLDTSKLEQDKMKTRSEVFDLVSVIRSCIDETSSLAVEKKLFINFDTILVDVKAAGDIDKTKQVIINLISNAVKYTEQGGVTIRLEKTMDDKYKISVTDTGRGIPPANVGMLFSKYQQVDKSKGASVVSTGLGLYISKLLAEKMGGKVALENTTVGKGSTFVFELPVYRGK
jgi:signal transduction histidine kinase